MTKTFFLAILFICLTFSYALADYSFSFNSGDGTFGVEGTLSTLSNGNGTYTVTGGSLIGDGTNNSNVNYDVLPSGTYANTDGGGANLTSDNLLSPYQPIVLDSNGITLGILGNNPNYKNAINIWGNSMDYGYFQSYSQWANNGGTALLASSDSPTPIPAVAYLLGSGLMGLIVIGRRMQK